MLTQQPDADGCNKIPTDVGSHYTNNQNKAKHLFSHDFTALIMTHCLDGDRYIKIASDIGNHYKTSKTRANISSYLSALTTTHSPFVWRWVCRTHPRGRCRCSAVALAREWLPSVPPPLSPGHQARLPEPLVPQGLCWHGQDRHHH